MGVNRIGVRKAIPAIPDRCQIRTAIRVRRVNRRGDVLRNRWLNRRNNSPAKVTAITLTIIPIIVQAAVSTQLS